MAIWKTCGDVITVIFWLLVAYMLITICTGCVLHVKEDAAIGVRFGTDIALYQTAPDDGSTCEFNLLEPMWKLFEESPKHDDQIVPSRPDPPVGP